MNDRNRQRAEWHNCIETVAEFRRKQPVDRFHIVAFASRRTKSNRGLCHISSTGIGGHDQNDVAKVDLLAVVIGQRTMIHNLQQNIVKVWMCLLDLIEQQHAMRMLIDAISQKTSLIEADIAGRRTDQTRYGVAFHILGHVESKQFHAQRRRKLLGNFCLTDTCRAGEQIGTNWLIRLTQACTSKLDGSRKRFNCQILTIDDALEFRIKMRKHNLIILGNRFGWNPSHGGNGCFDFLDADCLLSFVFRQKHLACTSFIDHVDGFVRQLAVRDVACRKLHRRLDGITRIFDFMEVFKIRFQTLHDFNGIRDRRLIDVNLLETTNQCPVFLEELTIFLIGGRTDATDCAGRQSRFQQVRCIHCTARRGACANHRMNFVNKQNRSRIIFELFHNLFQALFEIAAIAGPCKQRTHVERKNCGISECFRHFALNDTLGQTFGNRSLTDPRITHVEWVVLGPTAKNLNSAADFTVTTNQRIDTPGFGFFIQIDAIGRKSILLFLCAFFRLYACAFFAGAFRTARRAWLATLCTLRNAVRNIIDGIITRHLLFLEEVSSMAFTLRENGNEHIGARHFLTV